MAAGFSYLADHLRYHRWATQLVLDAASALSPAQLSLDQKVSHGSVFGTLAHVHRADCVWAGRLYGQPTDAPLEEDFARLASSWSQLQEGLIAWADRLPPEDWERAVSYASSGVPFATPIWKIVLHLVNHGTLHRGQVVAMLRQIGIQPPATDLIFYYRSAL